MTEDSYSLSEELRVALPPDIAEAFAYLLAQDALLDAGTPVPQLTFEEWRASHGR